MTAESKRLAWEAGQKRLALERQRKELEERAKAKEERTRANIAAGLKRRRDAGFPIGRPRALQGERLQIAKEMMHRGTSKADIARLLGIGRATAFRSLRKPKTTEPDSVRRDWWDKEAL